MDVSMPDWRFPNFSAQFLRTLYHKHGTSFRFSVVREGMSRFYYLV